MSKCELLSLHDLQESLIENVPIKDSVKYLGILVTKNLIAREHLNFSNRKKKTESIFMKWLYHKSIIGGILLFKTEALSLFVSISFSFDEQL